MSAAAQHERGCPQWRSSKAGRNTKKPSSTPASRPSARCGGLCAVVAVPWDERLSQAFLLDYRTREDLIREARLTPGEVEAADRCGRLPRSARKL